MKVIEFVGKILLGMLLRDVKINNLLTLQYTTALPYFLTYVAES